MTNRQTSLLASIMRTPKAIRPEQPKAYSYLRFSTAEQRAGDSFRRQTELAKRYAEQNGLHLDDQLTYHDLGVSGFSGANAQQGKLGEFLAAVRSNVVPAGSYLLVENLDRLSRQTARKALRTLEDIIDAGITVVTLMDGRQYTADSLDKDGVSLLIAILTMMRAHEESTTKQQRAKEAWKASLAKAIKGESRGASACPAWIRPTPDGRAWELIAERVAVVRRIFELAKRGLGKDSIAKRFNEERVPTFAAKQWWGSYIYRILNNAAVIGQHTPHERVQKRNPKTQALEIVRESLKPIKGYYPPAIPKRLWDDVTTLQKSSGRRGRHAARDVANIFAGIVACPACGGAMTRVAKGTAARSWPYLVCGSAKAGVKDEAGKPVCVYKSVGYVKLESAFLEEVSRVVEEAPKASVKARTLERERRSLEAGIDATTERLANLLAVVEKGAAPATVIDKIQELEALRLKAGAQLKKLDADASGLDRSLVAARLDELQETAGKLKSADATAAPALRTALNAILRRLVVRVVVDYTTGMLRFQWHHSDDVSELVYAWAESA